MIARPPVALFLIATNKYLRFVGALLESADMYFVPRRKVDVFLFTNAENRAAAHELVGVYGPQQRVSVHFREHPHLPWPEMTLRRYEIFRAVLPECAGRHGHTFYCDADMRFVDTVGEEILGDGLTATVHPGFVDRPRSTFTYDTNPASAACVAPHEGTTYFAGGFQGGSLPAYARAIETLAERTAEDRRRGVVALWHDESHWNRYLIDNPPAVTLSPAYCYPESWTFLPFKKKLLALDKNHAQLRE